MPSVRLVRSIFFLSWFPPPAHSLHNAIYYDNPPMGWRSWNAFQSDVNQDLMQSTIDAVVRKRVGLDGKQTSFMQLGYVNVGLDDGWQACGKGVHRSFHSESGQPIVDVQRFPDLKAMTAYGHRKGVRVGFYGNNCICAEWGETGLRDPDSINAHYRGDVQAIVEYNFDGVKIDACGQYV